MKKILLILLTMTFTISCQTKKVTPPEIEPVATKDSDGCGISGKAFKWQLSYCKWVTNTKDKTSAKYQTCLTRDEKHLKSLSECDKRNFLKEKFCKHQISLDYIKEGILTCMDSKELETKWLK